ncbi:hypothetical protein RDV89_13615 [Nocardioides zeae]|uniref:Uncharacterized protein n=1 Tax=Nocardioides imazamoxiresistens TaxID=3231893 RepID=A0ABU3PXZ1_9ACTN|nr:hypothetical protein [Nocardioides zeae]MDT9594115.1 hypothetical protein [Nocardioides zeae]
MDVAALAASVTRHRARPFPDCRGVEIDGVDLVLVDADLAGCVDALLSSAGRSPQHEVELRRVVADLERVVPLLPAEWVPYFAAARDLGRAALAVRR